MLVLSILAVILIPILAVGVSIVRSAERMRRYDEWQKKMEQKEKGILFDLIA